MDDSTSEPNRCYDPSFNEFEPSFANLPMEMLAKIFSYLTPSDRREAGFSCRRWFEAAHHTSFLENTWLALKKVSFDTNKAPVRMLLDSFRHFQNIHLTAVDFERIGDFFQHFGPHIRRIVFDSCDVQEQHLFAILNSAPNLRSLSLRSCRNLFICVVLFENLEERAVLRETLSGVTELSLTYNQYLSDAILHRLLDIMTSIRSLDVSGCNVSFHRGLYQKFYPPDRKQPSESVLTFQYISQLIAERKVSLRALDFSATLIDDNALEVLAAMGPDLHLERLEMNRCEQLSGRGLGNLLSVQASHLQHLNLSRSFRLADSCLVQICNELRDLRVLKMRECHALTNHGVRQLTQLSRLEVLDVSFCQAISGQGILEGIASKKNDNMRELHIGGLNMCERSIIAIAENLRELRVLNLGFCIHGMTNLCMQFICRNLVRLLQLGVEGCNKLSDGGLTGLGMLYEMQKYAASTDRLPEPRNAVENGNLPEPMDAQEPPVAPADADAAEAAEVIVPPIQPFRISLRSRAEQEIVHDAQRKRQLMEAMLQSEDDPTNQSSSSTFNGYTIARLQQLRVLNLSVCNSLTDVSLLFSFRFVELRELSLSRCKQFTHEGIQALVHGCPAIEKLDLSECFNIKDEAVRQIVIHLRRLHTLNLRACNQLTTHTLNYIASHCQQLRALDVRACKLMDEERVRHLVNMLQLTTILTGKTADDVADALFDYDTMVPAAPPPPDRLPAMPL